MKKQNHKSIDLSIVIPALGEERRIGKSLDELANFLRRDPTLKVINIEVLVVAANAGDKTQAIALSKKNKFENFRLLRPGTKLGKGRDVQYGVTRARGNAVLFMDADLATPIKHIPRFYKAFTRGAEVVVGTRNLHKHHPGYMRRFVSNIGNALFRIAGGVWIEDSQCGFKLFSRRAAKVCFSKMTIMKWGFDMEVLTIARVNGLEMRTYRINDWQSIPDGTFMGGLIRNSLVSLKELAQILWNRLNQNYYAEGVKPKHPRLNKLILLLIIPAVIYLLIYYIYQPHYLPQFFTAFYLDGGDGFQNVWNIWWVNKSIVTQHASPYFTDMVHWPHGTSLLPQTMNIYNGLVGIVLMNIFKFNLVGAVNFAVLSGFIGGGITMFWFIWYLYRRYVTALIAGALFTFSAYHFAHGQGHLQLISLQFIPLFLLAFWMFLEKLKYKYALFASLALFLVLLCDYYYVFWCVIIGGMWFAWRLYKKEIKLDKPTLKVLAVFATTAAILVGPLLLALTRLNKHDPLLGSHDPMAFSLDPFSIIIPGGSWVFRSLTDWHWTRLAYLAETSVYFGTLLLGLLAIAFYQSIIKRKKFRTPSWLNFWWIVMLVFGILALGPRLTMFGKHLEAVPMPYALLEKVFPTLQISGMPVRWILISLIAAIVIGSSVLAKINLHTRRGLILITIVIGVSLVELWPAPLPLTPTATRPYVTALEQLPRGAVIDNGALFGAEQLYHQTIHDKPMAFGYVTRLPQSVSDKSFHIFADIEEGRLDRICRVHKIRYITTPAKRPLKSSAPVIYDDGDTLIYDFKTGDQDPC